MNKRKRITCVVIGGDHLTLQCLSMLLEKKHAVLGVISQFETIKEWCHAHAIHCFRSLNDFEQKQTSLSVDILFSIANEYILPASVLKAPKLGSINYHNSPLPKYAGLYATSWSILNGETEHGVTWHWMHPKVDAGDILKQSRFPIEPEDTALSLNLKCYEHAVHTFNELLNELSTNFLAPIKQDLALRSYYGLKDKPPKFGFISHDDSAESIERLCRALYFGRYKNELATPKVMILKQVFVIQSCKKLPEKTLAPPGTIVRLTDEKIQISTCTTDILLLNLRDLIGRKVSLLKTKIMQGVRLTEINAETCCYLRQHEIFTQPKHEKYWVERFKKCIEHEVTFISNFKMPQEQAATHQIAEINLSEEVLKRLTAFSQKLGRSKKDVLLTIVLIYWYRLNNYKNFTISLTCPVF